MTCQENSHTFSIKLMSLLHLISAPLLVQEWPLTRWCLQVLRVLYGLLSFFLVLMRNCHIIYFNHVFFFSPNSSQIIPNSLSIKLWLYSLYLFQHKNGKKKNTYISKSYSLNVSYQMSPCMLLQIAPLILWFCLIYRVLHLNISILLSETTLFIITGSS